MILLKNLAFRNLQTYRSRSIALILFSFLMGLSVFAGSLIVEGMKHGLDLIQTRLGADILVVPESSKKDFDAQTVLIQANPGYFYMPIENYQKIKNLKGVEKASPQIFLASANAGCCSAKLQIIGFEPESDFTVQPWIQDTLKKPQMEKGDVIVGNNITVNEEGFIRLYGNSCRIKGRFDATGSSLDSAVYMNFDTVKALIQSSFDEGLNQYEIFDTESVISSVMIKVAEGYDIEELADNIQNTIENVKVITSKSMVSGISENLKSISAMTSRFIIIFSAVAFFMTLLIFMMLINERKREFASLISFGADKKILTSLVLKEAFFVNLSGGLTAILLSTLILLSFRRAFSSLFGAGFVLPQADKFIIYALLALLLLLFSSLISALLALYKIKRMDASFILKEGE